MEMVSRGDAFPSNGTSPYTQGKARRDEDFSSNETSPYVHGKVSVSDETDDRKPNVNTGDGYEKSRPKSEHDIECDKCGLLRDRWGYLILSNGLGGQLNGGEPEYFKPIRRSTYEKIGNTKSPRSCGRPFIIILVFIILVLAASIGVNIYQYLHESSESDTVQQPLRTFCPNSVSFLPGHTGEISCSIQYFSNTSSLSIDVYFIGDFTKDTQTYLAQETLDLPTGSINKNLSNLDIRVDIAATVDSLLEMVIQYGQVKCCDHGHVYINISGSLVLTIEVNVDLTMPCLQSHVHTIGQVNTISCTQCLCGNNSSLGLNSSTWYYRDNTLGSATQPDRIWQDEILNESTGLVKNRLVFNKTACFDRGLYILEIIDVEGQITQLNFTVQTEEYSQSSSQETVRLLTIVRVSVEVCLDTEPMAFLNDHNLTYMFIGNDDAVEFLQAENISVGDAFRLGSIGVVPAGRQTIVFESDGRSLRIRTNYSNGLIRFDVEFNRVQCFHGGQYLFFRNGSLLYNLTVLTDESLERTQTEIYQKAEVTGFVETFNITMECAARVGCTKRPYVMEPEIGSNTTHDYRLMDVNADGIMDLFIATINTTVVNISMALNDTDFICKVNGDDVTQEETYQIYVLNGTFCDSRPKNCEYFYPYQTLETCKRWVSCLDDRPRVKFCDFNNLYYHKTDGQCEGRCEAGCPWNI